MLTSRVEKLVTQLVKLARNLNFFYIKILNCFKKKFITVLLWDGTNNISLFFILKKS